MSRARSARVRPSPSTSRCQRRHSKRPETGAARDARAPYPGATTMTHILLIDDDPLVRYSVRTILEGAGHEVTEADNGRGGLECFRATRYDAVITDIIMPDMEGIETIRAIRALDKQMPVLA